VTGHGCRGKLAWRRRLWGTPHRFTADGFGGKWRSGSRSVLSPSGRFRSRAWGPRRRMARGSTARGPSVINFMPPIYLGAITVFTHFYRSNTVRHPLLQPMRPSLASLTWMSQADISGSSKCLEFILASALRSYPPVNLVDRGLVGRFDHDFIDADVGWS